MSKLLRIMRDTKRYISQAKGERMNCGAWLTNRLKEMQALGPDRVIAKYSS